MSKQATWHVLGHRSALSQAVSEPYERPAYRAVKRGLDLFLGSCCLLLSAPLLLLVAVAVKATSRGPVLFRQTRIGQGGREFRICLFRTMHRSAEDILACRQDLLNEYRQAYRIEDDPRLTVFGRFLRRSKFDRLPLLLNVLKGDMSLVGPIPVVREELELFGDAKRDYLAVKPGIFGLSHRDGPTYPERVELISQYRATASLASDGRLLVRSLRGRFFITPTAKTALTEEVERLEPIPYAG
jgi:lipopolysaccharide/colanic/teichoic acid biosynthesis glycosyltransferase